MASASADQGTGASAGTPPAAGFSERSYLLFRRDVLVYGLQIITEALIARALGPVAMGVWVILRLVPAYAEVVGRSQVDTAAIYILGKRKYSVGAVAFAIIVISIASAAFVIAAFLAVQHWLFATFLRPAADVRMAVLAILAYIPFRFLAICYNKLLLYDEDVHGYNTANVLLTLVPAVLGAVLVAGFHQGVAALAAALVAGGAAAVAYSAARVHSRHPITVHGNLQVGRDLMGFGLKLYAATLIQFLYTYGATTLAVLYLPTAQLAFLRMAQDRALLLTRAPNAVASLLYPRVARLGPAADGARTLTVRSVRVTLLILLGLGAIGALAAWPGVLILYGRAFAGVIVPLILLIPGTVADASTSLLMQYYLGLGRLWLVLALTTAGVAIQLGLLVVGLSRNGLAGGAFGITVAYVIVAALRVAVFCATESLSPGLIVPTRDDVRYVADFIMRRLMVGLRAGPHARGGKVAPTTEE